MRTDVGVFSRRGASIQYCQSWKDMTTAEIAKFSAAKTRAVCHLAKGHFGDHEDKVLELAWPAGGWPRAEFRSLSKRVQDASVFDDSKEDDR